MRHWISLLPAVLLATGCGLFNRDNETNPAPLVDIRQSLDVRQAWSVNIGGGSDIPMSGLRPAHRSGVVYAAAANGRVQAIELDSGRVVWTTATEAPVSAGPGVGSDVVVVGTIQGQVLALDLTTGARRWTAQASSEVLAAPAVADGIAVVRSQDGRVFGFRVSDGYRQWVYDQSVPLLTLRGNSAPLIHGGYAFLGFDNGKVAALRLTDGSAVWEQTVAVPQGKTELERIVDIDGPLAVVASDLYAVSYQGMLAALTADSGRLLWVKDMSSFAGLSAARTLLAVSDVDDAIWGLDRLNGGTLWKQDRLARRQVSAPAHHSNAIAAGDFDGYVHWLSEEDGSFVARERAGGSRIVAQPVSVGPILLVQTQAGKLVAFRISSG